MEGKMEATAEKLESMFEKTDADLDQISRKLDAEFAHETDEASGQVNKGELLEKISDIRKEYAEVVKEAQAIQDTQREAMEFFKGELMTLCGALTKLQFTVGMDGEPSSEELQKVSDLLGVPLPDDIPQSGHAVTGGTSEECAGETDCSSKKTGSKTSPCVAETNAGVDFKIEVSPHEKRANSNEFMEINDAEFQSVSSLVRGRVKLTDVNHTYRILWQHFKEGNSDPLSQSDLFKMGLRVTGHTGEAKLKVLKSLKLLTISKKGDVKLL